MLTKNRCACWALKASTRTSGFGYSAGPQLRLAGEAERTCAVWVSVSCLRVQWPFSQNLIYSRCGVSHCLWAWFQSPLEKIMACDYRIKFLFSKDFLWETTRKRCFDKVKCCICTYTVEYAIKLSCSEQACTVVNVWTCLVLHKGYLFPESLAVLQLKLC